LQAFARCSCTPWRHQLRHPSADSVCCRVADVPHDTNMVAKHLPPAKERLLLTVRMLEQQLPSSCRRRRVVTLSATPSSPSIAQLWRAAIGYPVAAFDQPQGAAAGTKEGAAVEPDGSCRANPGSDGRIRWVRHVWQLTKLLCKV
jgi:hypothetical protein